MDGFLYLIGCRKEHIVELTLLGMNFVKTYIQNIRRDFNFLKAFKISNHFNSFDGLTLRSLCNHYFALLRQNDPEGPKGLSFCGLKIVTTTLDSSIIGSLP